MKKLRARVYKALRDPAVRPLEVWAIRAAVAYVAVKLGITAEQLAPK